MEQTGAFVNDISFDEVFNINDFTSSNEEPLWDKLIEQIIEGNVIPVIGADMLIDNTTNLHNVIIECLARGFQVSSKPRSFSELIYDPVYAAKNKKDNVYYQVNKIFANKRFSYSKRLERLLSIRQFPFVITTSFTPLVEQAMRAVWKDELRIMRFNNNPAENQDIKNNTDLSKPTIYYMFGKVGEGAHKYVLTDTDMLDFVASWLSNDNKVRPKNLCNELKDKYLLMLGNNYSDWLFRFIWYSIRKPNLGRSMLAYDQLDETLINFLERTENFTKQNTSDVIDQIISRVERKLKEREETKFDRPEENIDVFISYSRSDTAIAEALYDKLTKQGKRVWYDKNNLSIGGNFMEEIRKAIRSAKYFIPIFSKHITEEKDQPHVYRNEWDQAVEVAISMGRTYIIPLAERGFDFYKASIPERMQQYNAVYISEGDDFNTIVEQIIHQMNQD
ncbi:MAG: toll/interleukin-1 receptor domain-containing protein [Paludibacteraceae bacterium]|nr:toll/interleukin-1 receptor domain-containing protein [Paludibacteraceae bacterium]